jgi:hypothetical protein
MSKVYVSSTFRDLRDCRQAVEEAVRLLGHQDLAMEHYGADPRPPLEKCLRDVEASDVYLGIFGRRYGWVPPGSTQSITELEYRHAIRSDKEILLFVIDEDARGWSEPEDEPPERKAQLARLREEASVKFLPGRFSSCQELAVKAIAALANLGAPGSTAADPLREDQLLRRVLANDPATLARSEQALVDMGSAAYAALLRARLREGQASQEQRTAQVKQLAEVEQQNHRVMPILRDLLGAADPSTRAAVVFEFAQRALRSQRVTDEDVLAITALYADVSADVRREVGHAMWKFLPRGDALREVMRDRLMMLIRDSDRAVRDTSSYSLRRLSRY